MNKPIMNTNGEMCYDLMKLGGQQIQRPRLKGSCPSVDFFAGRGGSRRAQDSFPLGEGMLGRQKDRKGGKGKGRGKQRQREK